MPQRADLFLVEHGYAASRSEAQAAIRAGNVTINGRPVRKPSEAIANAAEITYVKAHPYVSRGALKLLAALDQFALSPAGLTCLDIGASTGGFTEVLLERGARKVYAVDVGHDQLHEKLAADPRVVPLERTDIRKLDILSLTGRIESVVADVSFIGLKLALEPVLQAITHPAWLVALVKPQFEVGRDHVGKNGIVHDTYRQAEAVATIAQWLTHEPGWEFLGMMESPITGGSGNREFLVAARRV